MKAEDKFPTWPNFSDEEADAVRKVLLSNKVNYWTGQEIKQFEIDFAKWSGSKHAIAVANGTLALDLALHGLGIGSINGGLAEDEVIVTSRSFIASVSCVVNAGAIPVFVDVDLDTQNIDPEQISNALSSNTKAIIAVHLAGWPCDIDQIKSKLGNLSVKIIEDCAQAAGACYKGTSVGSLGDVSAWSFCQDKIITTGGEGGMVTCTDDNLWMRMWAYKDHGKSYDAVYNKKHPPGFRWLHESFGTNFRMTEMQAAIGRIQLRKIDRWNSIRQENVSILDKALHQFFIKGGLIKKSPTCVDCPGASHCGCRHAHYKYYVFIDPKELKQGHTRDSIIDEINRLGIRCFQGSCSEIYLENAFSQKNFKPKTRLRAARVLGETSIMFEVHPSLCASDMIKIADTVRQVFAKSFKT